jgi:glycosyltransferase involved in cell wall biosynthesis
MKVCSYIKGLDACSYHRVFMPNQSLNLDVRQVRELKEEDLEWCDILHYSRHTHLSARFLNEMRNKHGFKIIVDTDDWWEVPKDHPKYDFWSKSNISLKVREHMMNADAVTCTHERLANIVRPLNSNVYVIPNALDYGNGQFKYREQKKCSKVRLLYASSLMNYSNTAIIAGSMKKIKHLPIEIVIAGYHESPFFDILVQNLTGGVIPHRFSNWLPSEEYMYGYEGDIMILPSKDTEFNGYKSNLKVLEAAALKMPIIVSEAEPYLGMPVNYFKGEKEFIEQVELLVNSKKERELAGNLLYDVVVKQYSLSNYSQIRTSIYEDIQRGDSHSK